MQREYWAAAGPDLIAKNIMAKVKELGGKVVSDLEGNTWWEVPTGVDKV